MSDAKKRVPAGSRAIVAKHLPELRELEVLEQALQYIEGPAKGVRDIPKPQVPGTVIDHAAAQLATDLGLLLRGPGCFDLLRVILPDLIAIKRGHYH